MAKQGPLYLRVYDEITGRIANGSMPRGSQLAPERELSVEFGVSRVTIRRALAALASEGLVHAVQGRGTFVSAPQLAEPPNALLSFKELAESRDLAAGARVLHRVVRPATIDEAELFRIAPGSDLFDLERLRTLDSLPVAVDGALVPLACAPHLPDVDWEHASLYEELSEAGVAPVRADYAVEAQGADAASSALLAVPVGTPVLVAESTTYTLDDRLVEIGRIVYRGDRYRFRSTLIAQPPRPRLRGLPGPG